MKKYLVVSTYDEETSPFDVLSCDGSTYDSFDDMKEVNEYLENFDDDSSLYVLEITSVKKYDYPPSTKKTWIEWGG